MAYSLDGLRRVVRSYIPLFVQAWDILKADPNNLKALLSMEIDNRKAKENPVRVDHLMSFPEAHRLGDKPIRSGVLDRLEWSVPIQAFTSVASYDITQVDRPAMAGTVKDLISTLPESLVDMQTQLLMQVFRLNQLGRDGQAFFDASHPFPNAKGTFSNTLTHGFVSAGVPTIAEIQALYYQVLNRFITNQALKSKVLDLGNFPGKLTFIAHNEVHGKVLHQVLTQPFLGANPNELAGQFGLLRDLSPAAGTENDIEVVLSVSNGPRPSIFVLDSDPSLAVDDKNQYETGLVDIVALQQFGVKDGFPHTSIRATAA